MSNDPINRKGIGDRLYVAGSGSGNKVYLHAESLAEAKQRAVEHFRPKKKELGLIWVELVDQPINTSTL